MQRRRFIQTLVSSPLMLYGIGGVAAYADEDDADVYTPKDLLHRSRDPDRHYLDDTVISKQKMPLLQKLQQRLGRLQKVVGHGNFALLGVDDMRRYGRNYSVIGSFSKEEIALLEELFYADASRYGFFGSKPLGQLSSTPDARRLRRQSGSSQYLFKGEAERLYLEIKKALGENVVLTSGVRGVVKQMYLFLTKAVSHNGNLSLAARSLAPPGYSFHGVGDFDVGKRGWGARNFSDEFSTTDEFRKLQQLGFITMRYPLGNDDGVRYEPWHIKVHRA